VARPLAVVRCLAPFRVQFREKLFVSWVGLRGAVGIFLASIPLLVGLPNATVYFDIAFVVVLVSLLIQGWTIAFAAKRLHIALPRVDRLPSRIELDLPGQLAQELVGYRVEAKSPYLRRRLIPSWARPTLVIRDEQVHPATEAENVKEGDYVYLLAPPEKAQALDRFFIETTAQPPRPEMPLGDFFLPGDVNLGEVAALYDLKVAPQDAALSLADDFAAHLKRPAERGDSLPLGTVALIAHTVENGRVTMVGLQIDEGETPPVTKSARIKVQIQSLLRKFKR
jgi:cell volume regulation protein A